MWPHRGSWGSETAEIFCWWLVGCFARGEESEHQGTVGGVHGQWTDLGQNNPGVNEGWGLFPDEDEVLHLPEGDDDVLGPFAHVIEGRRWIQTRPQTVFRRRAGDLYSCINISISVIVPEKTDFHNSWANWCLRGWLGNHYLLLTPPYLGKEHRTHFCIDKINVSISV